MPQNLSFIGKGELHLAPRGTGQYVSVLNLASLKVSPEIDEKKLANTTSIAGGDLDIYAEVKGVGITLGGISQFSKENLALLLKGSTSSVAGGAVVAEPIKGYAGKLAALAKIVDTTKPVTVKSGAAEISAADYIVTAGGIRFLAGAGGFADGDDLDVDYTALAAERIDALTHPGQEYEARFIGLNAADGGAPVIVQCHRVRLGAGGLDLISEGSDFAKSELTGSLLVDTGKTGNGISQYLYMLRA
ncbi:hypothetical protein NH8B_0984 [Pseudogulbenkiania sp. NH8B]|uniref:phage tail tube protein n=1 Tax=Pseudogulbenkiania sp. (strain NH8B) TaxID=748280 RepID=UPI0002279A96|nr:hypothetical protein [Pseudogulbenkiania sp. NH8B]BAK75816.1 hypothetical protein NH8B_0984 [Pseudogulbenkiania sp. NH8B]